MWVALWPPYPRNPTRVGLWTAIQSSVTVTHEPRLTITEATLLPLRQAGQFRLGVVASICSVKAPELSNSMTYLAPGVMGDCGGSECGEEGVAEMMRVGDARSGIFAGGCSL